VSIFGFDGAAVDGFEGVGGVVTVGTDVDGAVVDVAVVDVAVVDVAVVGAGAAPAAPQRPTVRVKTARPPTLSLPILCIFAPSPVVWTSPRRLDALSMVTQGRDGAVSAVLEECEVSQGLGVTGISGSG
jgi:hypothetical protein